MTNPVPKEQQPLNEYIELKEAFFYRWATLGRLQYMQKLGWMWLGFAVIFVPVAMSIASPSRHPWQFICVATIGGAVGLTLPVLLMISGWSHVKQRLNSAKIFYEESGWYDGQTWEKPETELIKDRLLVTYEINPIMARLQKTLLCIMALLIVGFAILQIN